jgi:hypothetical protein
MHSISLVLVNLCLASILHSEAHRIKRFLNAEVHNRIDVLEQSHTAHREDTSLTRNIFFGALISVSVILLIIISIIIFLCRRSRQFVREHQSPALAAIQTSGLPHIHPMMNALFHALQRSDTIEQHSRDRPPSQFCPIIPAALGSNFNSSSSNVLKF